MGIIWGLFELYPESRMSANDFDFVVEMIFGVFTPFARNLCKLTTHGDYLNIFSLNNPLNNLPFWRGGGDTVAAQSGSNARC